MSKLGQVDLLIGINSDHIIGHATTTKVLNSGDAVPRRNLIPPRGDPAVMSTHSVKECSSWSSEIKGKR